MSDRLSRKDIKRDEFAEAVQRTSVSLHDHWKTIAAAVVAALLLVAAFFGYRAYASHRASQASQALDGALEVYNAAVDAAAPNPDAAQDPTFASEEARQARARERFTEVADRYGRTSAGALAYAYLGTLAAETGDMDAAREHWRKFLDRESDGLMANNVRLDLMRLDIAQGRGEEVATELEGMLASGDHELPEDVILFQLAAARETMGLGSEALSAYQRIVDEHPSSPYSTAARQKVATLGAPAAEAPLAF
jgi:predicted negative regulator of RcsB-dependent stress response